MTDSPGGRVLDADAFLSQAKIRRYQIFVLVLCAGMLLIDGYNVAVLSVIAPLVANDLHVTRGELGFVLAANTYGNVVGYFLLPLLSYSIGLKRVAIFSVLVFGVAESMAAFSGSLSSLLALRFIAGIGMSGAMVTAVSLTGEYSPFRWRASAVTYALSGYSFGQMVAGGVAHSFLTMEHPWRGPLLIGGCLGLLYSLVLLKWLPDSVEFIVNRSGKPERALAILNRISPEPLASDTVVISGKKTADRVPVRQLFEDGRGFITLMLWLAAIMSLMVSGTMHNWLTTLLVDTGLEMGDAVLATIIVSGAGVVAGFTVGPLMDRFGPFVVMVGLFLTCATAVITLGAVAPLLLVVPIAIAAFVQNYCSSGLSKGTYAMAAYLYPTAVRPTGIGWALAVSRAGAAVGPPIAGLLLAAGWAPSSVFKACAVPLLLGATAIYLAKRNRGQVVVGSTGK